MAQTMSLYLSRQTGGQKYRVTLPRLRDVLGNRTLHKVCSDKEIIMEVQNALSPTPEQLEGFLDPEAKGAIYMLNLLSFKEQAEYEDGRATNLSGKEAYQIYAAGVAKVITRVGGHIGFGADVERLMLGAVETLWEQVAIAMYPSRAAMLEMIQMPEYAEISVHRTAGLAGQLNLETVALAGAWLS